ncbi:MAG: hypothetical protein HY644_12120 [Acidobacteria bacterium]|nr:hypothetical protein [Acidobacteriota bacterium]
MTRWLKFEAEATLTGLKRCTFGLFVVALGAGVALVGCQKGTTSPGASKQLDYLISINYELGMHCTGFDFSYCCVLPPYNSIQAQVVRHESTTGGLPKLLAADPKDPGILVDGENRYKLHYEHVDNSYSEGNKMAYWNVPYDINGNGNPYEANENVANAYFRHLYIYGDLEGSNPKNTSRDKEKMRVGVEIPIPIDSGPAGQPVSNGYMKYSGEKGTIVFTKSPVLDNVPIVLTNPGIWEALGLPLTPFADKDAAKGIMKLEEKDIQPYQMARVTLVDAKTGKAVLGSSGNPTSFTGTNPIDVPNCYNCHANSNANGVQYNKYKDELNYWKSVGASEWFAHLKATAISIMEIHDAKHGTEFLKNYNAKASGNRLGRQPVLCQDCHADNVIGKLHSKTVGEAVPRASGEDKPRLISPLTEAMHAVHQRVRPLSDSQGRTGACQGCHPAHRFDRSMENYPITTVGENNFAKSDNRDAAGGCFVGRDAHSNADAKKETANRPSHLNAVGEYLQKNVVYENGRYKGLWCTNCHNQLTRELYQRDNLKNPFAPSEQETIRGKSLAQIASAIGVSETELISKYIDPKVPLSGEDTDSGVQLTWAKKRLVPSIAVIEVENGAPVVAKDEDGDANVKILSANPNEASRFRNGLAVPYEAATHGRDYWLSAGEPHCADCHAAPFVEAQGGVAFPINQPGKYSLMRYSKGHSGLACQVCHESIHGLYPANPKVDPTTYNQAAIMNADGSHGPVKCASCHVVNSGGVPKIAEGQEYKGKKIGTDLEAAIAFMHSIAPDVGGAIPK